MNDKGANALSLRQLHRRKRQKQDFFTALFGMAGFLMVVGILIGGTGLICFIPFHNLFSKIMLFLGIILFFVGFASRILEVLLKILGVRS